MIIFNFEKELSTDTTATGAESFIGNDNIGIHSDKSFQKVNFDIERADSSYETIFLKN